MEQEASTPASSSEAEGEHLENAASWRTIEQAQRDDILRRLHIEEATVGATGTEQEVLNALDEASLDDWRTRTDGTAAAVR